MEAQALEGGFAAPPQEAAQAFRAIMTAMARPGLIQTVTGATPPAPMSAAAGTILLVLADRGTPVHLAGPLDCAPVRDWITFHIGAPLVEASDAVFAVGAWSDLQPLARFALGQADYPDRSATVIVEQPELSNDADDAATLQGPGIKDSHRLNLPEMAAFQANQRLFPLGLDFYFTCGAALAGLPRTTRVS